MKALLICCISLLYSIPLWAQPCPDSLWSITINGLGKTDISTVLTMADGGNLFVGCVRIPSESGDTRSSHVSLLKTDSAGVVLWNRAYQSAVPRQDFINVVRQLSDGSFIGLGGTLTKADSRFFHTYLVKFKSTGDTLWTRQYRLSNLPDDESGVDLRLMPDGGFLLATQTYTGDAVYTVRTDNDGHQLFTHSYAGIAGISNRNRCERLLLLESNEFLMAKEDSHKVQLLRCDSLGMVLWSHHISDTVNYQPVIERLADGGFVVADIVGIPGKGNDGHLLARLDSAGNRLWTQWFQLGSATPIVVLQQTADNGFIVASFGRQMTVVKTDAQGTNSERCLNPKITKGKVLPASGGGFWMINKNRITRYAFPQTN